MDAKSRRTGEYRRPRQRKEERTDKIQNSNVSTMGKLKHFFSPLPSGEDTTDRAPRKRHERKLLQQGRYSNTTSDHHQHERGPSHRKEVRREPEQHQLPDSQPIGPHDFREGQTWYQDTKSEGQPDYPSVESMQLRISNRILRAACDFPELKGPDGEAAEEAVNRLLGNYGSLSGDLQQTYQQLETANGLAGQLQAQSQELFYRQEELKDSKNKIRICQSDVKDKEKELMDIKKENVKAQQQLREQIAKLNGQVNHYRFSMSTQEHEHQSKIEEAQKRRLDEVMQLRSQCDHEVQRARESEKERQKEAITQLEYQIVDERTKWCAHLKILTDECDVRVTDVQLDSSRRLKEQKEKYDEELRAARESYDNLLKGHKAQLSHLENTAEEAQSKLRNELAAEKARHEEEQKQHKKELSRQAANIAQKYTDENHELRTLTEELKLGLFERKHFRGLKDRDLTSQFDAIIGRVRDFANIEWDIHQQPNAALAERELFEIHPENVRKLKKQIVQHTFWVLLYEHVLRTPFTILGTEGWALDADWVKIHDPKIPSDEWPMISADVERKRYETAKALLQVVESPTNTSGNFKTAYENSISLTLDALHHALGKVAYLDDERGETLEHIVRLCAKTWIAFCSQPYRLLVALPSASGDLLSSPGVDLRLLTLVINPELRRYGNSQGENLKQGEVVPGCQSGVRFYPTH